MAQFKNVGYGLRKLKTEPEMCGCIGTPTQNLFARWQGVKSIAALYGVKYLCILAQVIFGFGFGGKQSAAPVFICPNRAA